MIKPFERGDAGGVEGLHKGRQRRRFVVDHPQAAAGVVEHDNLGFALPRHPNA